MKRLADKSLVGRRFLEGRERVLFLLGEGLSEETFQQRPPSSKGVMPTPAGSVFQEEGRARAKVLRLSFAWPVAGAARRPVCWRGQSGQ